MVARVATQSASAGAEREVAVAGRLASTDAPVAPLDPRVEAQVFDESGFAITLWAYRRPVPPTAIAPSEYADALARLHQGMREIEAGGLGHVTDRVAEAQGLVDDVANASPVSSADRDLVSRTLTQGSRAMLGGTSSEQLLHGEPHPGNLIRSGDTGLVFVDLETTCRGPVEFDIAHATIVAGAPPTEVAALYPGADIQLMMECWRLTLALAIAWRFEPGDDLPNGAARAREWARQLRTAPSGG